jgi:hypothetical protein
LSSRVATIEFARFLLHALGHGLAALQLAMGYWLDLLDQRPGVPPGKRIVGKSAVLIMPVAGAPSAKTGVHLVLRVEPNGNLFASITCQPPEDSERK